MIRELQEVGAGAGIAAVGAAPAVDEVRRVMGWARSVIAAAVCYLPPEEELPDTRPRGLVARFARSVDYHEVVRGKLAILAEVLLRRFPQARVEACVDTCPIPERGLAVLAGIGWRGKNGNVFVDGCGSYAALGEIVTDIELPFRQPILDQRCGECDACMRACPTGAIVAPYTVDPAKCISALTQSPGPIPGDLRSAVGNRVYGCDACQEACPCNSNAAPTVPEFARRVFPGKHPELIPLIRLTAQDFSRGVKNSSIGWIRRTRIRRNAAIAAGNLGRPEAIPALRDMLTDPNSVLRETAEWAIARCADQPWR